MSEDKKTEGKKKSISYKINFSGKGKKKKRKSNLKENISKISKALGF